MTDHRPSQAPLIPMQDASQDIWDKKYRLKNKHGDPIDQDIDATYRRVARALADVETTDALREHWYERFVWALRRGAIPAGRITSNAGAQEHKPATSSINCTVSGTVEDSMDDIMRKAHEAALTLRAGCGIGYCFSTLRPKGAFVAGAGANTSGPLSFMDIYDKMCFTVASAGGRRGAQMGTFDVSHPDVMDFIRAKREDGRLRQFNLSLLITDDFIEAVKHNASWPLVFPISAKEQAYYEAGMQAKSADLPEVVWRPWPTKKDYWVRHDGLVACRVYKRIPARNLWDMIMTSTYDFAEPGFILIDRVNEMNNNWWDENIQATNPCVTADTRLATDHGLVTMGELYNKAIPLNVTVDRRALQEHTTQHALMGTAVRPAVPVFMTAQKATVYRVVTSHGYEIKATAWHDFYTPRGKLKLNQLHEGDQLLVQSGQGQFGNQGSAGLGKMLGLMSAQPRALTSLHDQAAHACDWMVERGLRTQLDQLTQQHAHFLHQDGGNDGHDHEKTGDSRVLNATSVLEQAMVVANMLAPYVEIQDNHGNITAVPEVVWQGTKECVQGYVQGVLAAGGKWVMPPDTSCRLEVASSQHQWLLDLQTVLANWGIMCSVKSVRQEDYQVMFVLSIEGRHLHTLAQEIGFLLPAQAAQYDQWHAKHAPAWEMNASDYLTTIVSIDELGQEAVFDTTQDDHNTVIFNGLVTGQCGEQPLPPYGSCLLGSINLTNFVRHPFTDQASFDWDEYKEVVRVFTRMLDNVVEINGLPLPQQRHEIMSKRRHGMGFLGLGSTLTMMTMEYGSDQSIAFTEEVSKVMALEGWRVARELAVEKGPAPFLAQEIAVTEEMLAKRPEMVKDGWQVGQTIKTSILHARYSRYMQRIASVDPELVEELATLGARFTHHSSIAPTGTISLSLANNASNGIEPSFAHHYSRNVIREGKKTKEKVEVYSYELLAYRTLVNPKAMPYATNDDQKLPSYFITADDIKPKAHVDIQAASQKWIDSSISKTANVPTDFPYEEFKDIYLYAHEQGLKGCTTFRFNPAAFQGVLVKETDLENTTYRFELEDGTIVEARGNEEIFYDGETHTAANLFDALKEGYYGKY